MISLSLISSDVLDDCLKNSALFRSFVIREILMKDIQGFRFEIEQRILANKSNKIAAIKDIRGFAAASKENAEKLALAFPNAGFGWVGGPTFNTGIGLADAKRFVERYI